MRRELRRGLRWLLAAAAVALATGLPSGEAAARPLKLSELHAFGTWLTCADACPTVAPGAHYDDYVKREGCLVACGRPPRLWEKDGIAPVDRVDLDLALLEYNHAQDTTRALICYGDPDETVVIPAALCAGRVCEASPLCSDADCAAPTDIALTCTDDQPGGPRCVWPTERRSASCPDVVCDADPVRSFQECADGDGDALPLWLERHLGTDDGVDERRCGADRACAFNERCVHDPQTSAGRCEPRDCGGPCTAFHMELVAEDDTEVLVHVFYDYSPIPARAADLYIDYDRAAMTLADARPLTPLALHGKQLATSHLSDGTLRLSIFDTGSSHPIPTGPVIELVFRRSANQPTRVAFVTDDALQQTAIAPLQGDAAGQGMLADDALWGEPIDLASRDEASTKMRLWYGFDTLDAPLSYANIPSAEDVCARYPLCANEDDPTEKAHLLARLEALQRGTFEGTSTLPGVTSNAAFLDGSHDHLRLPVTWEEPLGPEYQSFSFSTWFYTEGNSVNELKTTPQYLYTHNGYNERTRWGLRTRANPAGGIDLELFDGDVLSQNPLPTVVPVATELAAATWHHVGFTYDALSHEIELYFDGQRVREYTFPRAPTFVCPQFFAGRDVMQHVEGDVLGGAAPEYVHYAASRSNLDAIERMDASGLGAMTIIGDSQTAYRDPDYNADLDRLVYSSNASGSFEIWVANGDGSNRLQLTTGFGDAARGIAARRPKWAPDGTGIVFESNVFDVLSQDNTWARVSHLYYIAWEPRTNEAAIELPSGEVTDHLDYGALLMSGALPTFRVTRAVQDRNHRNAHWLRGSDRASGARGQLLIETSSPSLDAKQIHVLNIPELLELSTVDRMLGLGESWQELSLLAAHRSVKAGLVPRVTERVFFERAEATYAPASGYTVTATPAGRDMTVSVGYAPPAPDAQCWDRNRNRLRDSDEDRNADGSWTTADCLPHELRNLFIAYDGAAWVPVLEDDQGRVLTPGAVVVAQDKTLRLKEVEAFGRSFVRVEVMSPLDAAPLVAGEIARLRFIPAPSGEAAREPFAAFERQAISDLFVKDLTTVAPPTPFDRANLFEQIDDAAFSPDGARLLLAAISRSRPVLLRTKNLLGADASESLFTSPTKLTGFDWGRGQNFYACNWVGGALHLQNKQILGSLRGGLDDLKLYAGLRDPDSFRSEAERGFEILARDGRDDELPMSTPVCGNSHAECPAYHLCVDSRCVSVPCSPDDPYSCSAHEARCTLRPSTVEQENRGPNNNRDAFDWVCAADCNVDAQCFTQQCLNGPCRFCEQSQHACVECREVVQQLGALTISTIEGCPDQKSFACVEGACVTECYAFEDGQSKYLCDPLLEYCYKGRCVMHDWTWWDLAPATFAGAGETIRDVPPDPMNGWPGYSQAVDQRVQMSVTAYGVTDYGQAPELVVEVRGGPFYGQTWSRIARILVHNRTTAEARANPYVVASPHPFNDARMRLITAPYNNLSGAASGLGDKDAVFCLADFAATAAAAGTPNASPDACYYRAQGSRYSLGYGSDVTPREALAHCRERGHANCPASTNSEHDFLRGGHPAVVVLEAEVAGGSIMNNITSNRVCSYEGQQIPTGPEGAARKLFYGDIAREKSPERDVFCRQNPEACASSSLIEFDRATYGHALLNCNVVDPVARSEAGLTFQNIIILRDFPLESGAIVETANNCTVDIDAFRTEPCYTWMGGGGSVDPNNKVVTNGGQLAFATFEFGGFTTFGHGEGYSPVSLARRRINVQVTGASAPGLVVGFRNSVGVTVETFNVPASTGVTTLTSADDYAVGRVWRAFIQSQPAGGQVVCSIPEASRQGTVAAAVGGTTIQVACRRASHVVVTSEGIRGPVTLTRTATTNGGTTPDAVEDLVVTTDGASRFGSPLPQGSTWAVTIRRQPDDAVCTLSGARGTMASIDMPMTLSCRPVATSELRVAISGLAGSGLELIERRSGRTLRPTADGTVAFPGLFTEGAAWEIGVATQPDEPAQRCAMVDGRPTASGTMPATHLLAARLSCEDLPTWRVSGIVNGLRGRGLRLALNTLHTVTIDPPAASGAPVAFAFDKRLLSGTEWTVAIIGQPEGPAQDCQVILGTGTIDGADVANLNVLCGPRPVTANAFLVGGTVEGLRGTGLRLRLADRTQYVDVSQNGAFAFPTAVAAFSNFEVQVDRQPGAPAQACAISAGSGRVEDRNVESVRVSCRDAIRVTVDIQTTVAEGAHVKALLVRATGDRRLVAVSPSTAKVNDGQAFFVMRVPQASGDGPDAALEPGEYRLYLFINDDLSFDPATGQPRFNGGTDRGAIVFVTGTAERQPRILVTDGGLKPLLPTPVVNLGHATFGAESEARCWFAPAGFGPLTNPTALWAPVLGTSARVCGGDLACPGPQATAAGPRILTNFQGGIPEGLPYDVTCQVTTNGNRLTATMSSTAVTSPFFLDF